MMRKDMWTEAEKERVLELRLAGRTAQQIADALPGRTRNGVCGIIERMVMEGRDIPPTYGSRPRKSPQPTVERLPKRPGLPFWEMDASDRRYVAWRRAREAARYALEANSDSFPR